MQYLTQDLNPDRFPFDFLPQNQRMRIESDTENAKEPPAEQLQQQNAQQPQQHQQQQQQSQAAKSRSGSQTVSFGNLIICANGLS